MIDENELYDFVMWLNANYDFEILVRDVDYNSDEEPVEWYHEIDYSNLGVYLAKFYKERGK